MDADPLAEVIAKAGQEAWDACLSPSATRHHLSDAVRAHLAAEADEVPEDDAFVIQMERTGPRIRYFSEAHLARVLDAEEARLGEHSTYYGEKIAIEVIATLRATLGIEERP